MTLAEERELLRRVGPDAMRAVMTARSGMPTRITRAEVLDVDWFQGEASIRETGDPHIKTNVRWMPGCFLYIGELVWYLKFGNDGIILGSSVGDKTETDGVGAKFTAQDSSPLNATFTTASATYVADATNGPALDIYVELEEPIRITVQALFNMDAAGTNGACFSWRATHSVAGADASSDNDLNGCETGVVGEWVPGSKDSLWQPENAGNYVIEMVYRRIGSANGLFKQRRIMYQRQAQYTFDF
jgi:hypothetical protein